VYGRTRRSRFSAARVIERRGSKTAWRSGVRLGFRSSKKGPNRWRRRAPARLGASRASDDSRGTQCAGRS
jgi:hypothetical protein